MRTKRPWQISPDVGALCRYALTFVDQTGEVGGDEIMVRLEVPRRAWNDLNHAQGEAWDEITGNALEGETTEDALTERFEGLFGRKERA